VQAKPSAPSTTSDALSTVLAALSIVLLVIFLASILTTALPPKPLEPQWQLALIAALINNGSLALVGALLTPLALWINPKNMRLRARLKACRGWALAAALGFLLLIPLQAAAGWRLFHSITSSQEQQGSLFAQQLSGLREAINSASSQQDLQLKLQKLFGNNAGLTPAQLNTPINELRQQLLSQAEQASNRLQQRLEAQASLKPDRLIRESLRIAISSVAYGVGFAFLGGALPRNSKKGGIFG
jgi:hypothetical protein